MWHVNFQVSTINSTNFQLKKLFRVFRTLWHHSVTHPQDIFLFKTNLAIKFLWLLESGKALLRDHTNEADITIANTHTQITFNWDSQHLMCYALLNSALFKINNVRKKINFKHPIYACLAKQIKQVQMISKHVHHTTHHALEFPLFEATVCR